MLNRIFKSGLIGVFALVMIVAFTSCKKEKETIAVIIVKKNNGQVVPGASVTLFPDSTISYNGSYPDPSLTKTNKTDVHGQVEFTYALAVVLNIEVSKIEGNDTITGVHKIKLETGKSITQVVEIN